MPYGRKFYNGLKLLEMARKGWTWMEWLGIVGNGKKCLEMAS